MGGGGGGRGFSVCQHEIEALCARGLNFDRKQKSGLQLNRSSGTVLTKNFLNSPGGRDSTGDWRRYVIFGVSPLALLSVSVKKV